MDQSVNRFLVGFAAALLLCSSNAAAQSYVPYVTYVPPPSANEAHDFLADTFRRYAIGYVVWYGERTSENHRGRADFYSGRDCHSEMGSDRSGRVFAVDWSTISSVEISGTDGIYVMGQLVRPAQHSGNRPYTNFHIYSPDARVSKSLLNAFQVLRSDCRKRSRFD